MLIKQIQTYYLFGSGKFVAKRNIHIYLPPDYYQDRSKRFPVLYMQDGQNLFNPRTSFAGVAWQIDKTAQELILKKKISSLIIVGIDNSGEQRINEYTPIASNKTGGKADKYSQMLIYELKPFIDHHYRTLPEREFTGLGGSSLGGLFSLYLGIKRPDVFSRLAIMSPSLWWADGFILREVLALPSKQKLRVWLDIGKREGRYIKNQARLLQKIMIKKGWKKHRNDKLADFRYLEAPKAGHNEFSWGERFGKVLKFLFPIV